MRSRMGSFFEVLCQCDKMQKNGAQKKVAERYAVSAISWDEAERVITKEVQPYASGEFVIKSIVPASYHEVFFSDKDEDDKWYKAKLGLFVIDEKTGDLKCSKINYLVQAESAGGALKNINEVMGQMMSDYEVFGINETKILDVFENNNA